MTREEIIKNLQTIEEDGWNVNAEAIEAVKLAVEALFFEPSIDKKGKWIVVRGMLSEHYNCSVCKKGSVYKTNYCPNCGAQMKEGD